MQALLKMMNLESSENKRSFPGFQVSKLNVLIVVLEINLDRSIRIVAGGSDHVIVNGWDLQRSRHLAMWLRSGLSTMLSLSNR